MVNDYTAGAIGALSWVLTIMEDGASARKTKGEITAMLKKINHGIGKDFKWKMENLTS